MGINQERNIAKKIVVGGLILALSACQSPRARMEQSYQENSLHLSSQNAGASQLKKDGQKSTLIVLSPHYDDAVLSVGGTISEFDGPKYIVTFFTAPTTAPGLTTWDGMSGFANSAEANIFRAKENANAAHLLGARIINLPYMDNQYETPRSPSYSLSIVDAIAKNIGDVVVSMKDAHVIVLGPSVFGYGFTHPDHLLVSEAFMQTVKSKKYPDTEFKFYEDLPYALKKVGERDVQDVHNSLEKMLIGFYQGLQLKKKEMPISREAFESKISAIREYGSQITAFHGHGDDLIGEITRYGMERCQGKKPCEVIHEVQSP